MFRTSRQRRYSLLWLVLAIGLLVISGSVVAAFIVLIKEVQSHVHHPGRSIMSTIHPTIKTVRNAITRTVGSTFHRKPIQIVGLEIGVGCWLVPVLHLTTVIIRPPLVHSMGRNPIIACVILGDIFPIVSWRNHVIVGAVNSNHWHIACGSFAPPVIVVRNSNNRRNTSQHGGNPSVLCHGPG